METRMHAYKAQSNVTEVREIVVKLPPDFPLGDAEVIVLAETKQIEVGKRRSAMQALIERLSASPGSGRSKEEIDRYLREERASWDLQDARLP